MSHHRSEGGLNENDLCYLKLFKIVISEARIILYHIFLWGCERDLTESFESHLKVNLNMSNKLFNNLFDKGMQVKIAANPAGDNFDVSLLNVCIMHACPKMSKEDKDKFIKPIKDFRNNIIHNPEVEYAVDIDSMIDNLREMIVRAIQKASEIYERSQQETDAIVTKMDEKIKEIKDHPLPVEDAKEYRERIRELRKANRTIVQEKGVTKLKENYKELSNVDPVSWLTGRDRLDVNKVFTRLDIIVKTIDENSSFSIDVEGLLDLKTEEGNIHKITVVEGDAGSGKSTLAKFVLKSWADIDADNPRPSIKGLERYQLVLYFECRNKTISTFLELISTYMPQVSDDMLDSDFIKAVLALQTLVIIDGLDEMREKSSAENLITEMFEKYERMSQGKLHFLITTRPQKINVTLFGNHSRVHAKLTGIPLERRVELVQKLHDAMISKGISKQSTSKLVDYVRQSQARLGEHYRLPLNLTLLTYLWTEDSSRINSITSATRLYDAVLKLLKLRLTLRVKEAITSNEDLEDNIEEFLKTLFEVYSETYTAGYIQLSEESFETLEKTCKYLHLPFEEMIGPFFAVDTEWTPYGNKMYLSAPHKSIMEFFCAFQIFHRLTGDDESTRVEANMEELRAKFASIPVCSEMLNTMLAMSKTPKSLMDILKESLRREKDSDYIDYADHHNMLLHLGGLMALKDRKVLHDNASTLVKCLEEGGVSEAQLLDLVAESECDPKLTSLVAVQISEKLVVRDGHTLAALQIFKDLDKNLPVQVILECEVKYIPQMEDFMEMLSERDCSVELLLKNHWKNPWNGNSTKHLEKLFSGKCEVTRFTGNLNDLSVLPEIVEDLRLTIANDDQAKEISSDINTLQERLSLNYLGVHITKDVDPRLLKTLPVVKLKVKECGTIWISNIGNNNVKKACDIAKALLPIEAQYNSIMFPRSHLGKGDFKELLQELKNNGVRVSSKGSVRTDSQSIDKTCVRELRDFTRETLGCEFHWGDERSVW